MEDKQYRQRYFQMLLKNEILVRFYMNLLLDHLRPVMKRRNEDVYRLQSVLFSAKSNEFDH